MPDTTSTAPKVTSALRSLMLQWQLDKEQRLTIPQLAQETGLSERALRRWANTDMKSFDAAVLAQLCHFFGVGIEAVLVLNGGKAANAQ